MRLFISGGILLAILAGCASAPASPPVADRSHVPPAVEGRVPTTYTKIQATEPQRPDWINTVPEESAGTHYLVGMSQQHGSERDAREEAMRDAREAFAKYTGVQVSAIEEMSRSLYGSSSAVLDATVAGSSRSTESTDAQVSRIKAWKWYVETSRATKGQIDQGITHQAWVLVTVPASEYARVQEWKASRANEEKARQAALKETADREKEQLLAEHQRRLAQAVGALGAGEIVRALSLFDAEYKRLGALADERAANGGFFVETAAALRTAQQDLVARGEAGLAGVHLDMGLFGPVCYLLPGGENKISVWSWLKDQDRYLPVPKLPLRLEMAGGKIAARGTSDSAGRTDFSHGNLPAGNYRVAIDLDAVALRNLAAPLALAMVPIEGRLTVAALPQNLDGVARGLVARLFAGPALAPPLAKRIILAPITYGEGGQGSEFALQLKQILSERLTQIAGLEVVVPRRRGAEDVAKAAETVAQVAQTRGISAARLPALGSGATQAIIDGADAALEGYYAVRGEEVRITLQMKAAGSDQLLGTASAGLRQDLLPAGVQLLPAATTTSTPPADFGAGSIRLEITSHLGNGQTYADGETISYFVRTDRDAYLQLIYEDAEHNLIRILPNRYAGKILYRAGSTLQIPTEKDNFEFTVTAPFGVERVWAFAASVPFPELSGQELDNGLLLLHGSLYEVLEKIHAFSRSGGIAYGEAQTTITTVSRRTARLGR